MNRILKILPFYLLIVFGCNAQDIEPSDFIPTGYSEFEKHFGDPISFDNNCYFTLKNANKVAVLSINSNSNSTAITALFKNEKGDNEARPDYTGTITSNFFLSYPESLIKLS